MLTPLLTTKLYIPPVRPTLVSRPRLIERISGGMHRKLTLISAPAGFGKTTLLSECAARCARQAAWLSLDESDNDITRFLAYLIAALQSIDADIGKEALNALQAVQAPPIASLLVGLINELAAVQTHFILVLDDYHLIEAKSVHDAISFLLDHQPPQMHLVLATRADPPLPLAGLRARDQLVELRQSDLRFTAEEAATFLNKIMGLDLSAEHVAALEARTEGWIAGLQMAALSLQGHSQDPATRSECIQAFTGSHRFVLDYLVEEVLEQQPPALQRFLLRTSIMERLTGSLCDEVVENLAIRESGIAPDALTPRFPNSQSVLEYLEAANLFIVPLDDERGWYRYHRLFADLLRKRLSQASPDLVPALHRRASAWYERAGLMAAAIDHSLAAHDLERAAAQVEQTAEVTMMHSEVTTLLNWMGELPDELVRGRPTLCFFHAWALLMSGGSLDRIEQRLRDMACTEHDPGVDVKVATDILAGRMAALHAYMGLFQGDMHRAAELCHQALAQLPEGDLFPRAMMTWILSLVGLFDDDVQGDREALQEIVRMSQEIGNPLIAVTALRYRAKLQVRQGHLRRAHEMLERALQLATDAQGQRLPIASEPLIGLGELKREWNELEEAQDCLLQSIELARQWSELAAFDAYGPLARVRLAQGNQKAALEALEEARWIAARSEITGIDDLVADMQQAQFSILLGDLNAAVRWAERRELIPAVSPKPCPGPDESPCTLTSRLRKYEHLVLARLFIEQGRAAQALDLLEPLLALARQRNRADLTIEVQILRALACQVEGDDPQAMDALAEALSLAEPGGFLRVFLDEGEPMCHLISGFRSQLSPSARETGTQEKDRLLLYTDRLLAAFPGQPVSGTPEIEKRESRRQHLVEPLSRRELEVLRLLGSGLSNPEIADRLYIAVSTVRSHCKSIYGKLNVHKRWDAVERGKELGLI